jgi:hypothetical protein
MSVTYGHIAHGDEDSVLARARDRHICFSPEKVGGSTTLQVIPI